jgi:hypothetical protein
MDMPMRFDGGAKRVRVAGAMGVALVALAVASCGSDDGSNEGATVSSAHLSSAQEQALKVARERVVDDAFMEIGPDRVEEVRDEGENWHVLFPYNPEVEIRGGEPHVIVRKSDNSIVEVYYTR